MEKYMAMWGAVLSTILAFIKIIELWKKRLRLFVSRYFTGDPGLGNTITIENPSDRSLIINYWELIWKKGSIFCLKEEPIDFLDHEVGIGIIEIKPYSSHKIYFQDQNHFDWGVSTIKKGKLYIRLSISGRKKPISLLVYDPS